MRNRSVLALLLVVSLGAAISLGGANATTVKPSLRIASSTPLKLAGTHFQANERVRVTGIVSMLLISRTVTTSAAGTFTLTFASNVSVSGCHGEMFVLAVGNKGSRATLKRPPRLAVCVELAP